MTREWADPYVYQGTGVLVNKLGIRDENLFKNFEYEQTDSRTIELQDMPLPSIFDISYLKFIHGYLFQDVYEWAGKTRTIDLSKGGDTFDRPQNIHASIEKIDAKLQKQNHLQGLIKQDFVEKITDLFADLNALHPFREGNGRSTREFLGQMARAAGYELDQKRIDIEKNQWNLASTQSLRDNLKPIKEIFSRAIRPSRAVAFEMLPRELALKRYPELQLSYAALDSLQETLANRYRGNKKAQEHFLVHARTETLRKLDQGMPIVMNLMNINSSNRCLAESPLLGGGVLAKPIDDSKIQPDRESLFANRMTARPGF